MWVDADIEYFKYKNYSSLLLLFFWQSLSKETRKWSNQRTVLHAACQAFIEQTQMLKLIRLIPPLQWNENIEKLLQIIIFLPHNNLAPSASSLLAYRQQQPSLSITLYAETVTEENCWTRIAASILSSPCTVFCLFLSWSLLSVLYLANRLSQTRLKSSTLPHLL